MTQPTMVFHVPYRLDPDPTSASRVRPLRMREAFADAGYRVLDVTGTPRERRAALRAVRVHLRAGGRVDFLYSESSTMPNALAGSVRQGLGMFVEPALWRLCRSHDIPFGIYYRDVYWRFDRFRSGSSWWWAALLQVLYRADLLAYRASRAHLFLPSAAMAPIVPVPVRCTWSELPPGAEIRSTPAPEGLSLFYVGGLGGHYEQRLLLRALSRVPGIPTTLCVPPAHWAKVKQDYEPLLGEGVKVVHARGGGLDIHYAQASVGLLVLEPSDYLDFAVPVKLFEYLGRGRPVIASAGTASGDIIEATGAGWTVPYDDDALTELLRRLQQAPEEIEERARIACQIREDQTWTARAREVARVLEQGVGRAPGGQGQSER